ncbi:MAG: class IV adenylate cyclase [Anaerolineales bacterium]|nr:class IV adenylate cyclase [Anaerolineales bacterium]
MENQEIEVKYYVQDLAAVRRRLEALGAPLAQPRLLETNLRFDTPDGRLGRALQALRLRQDSAARLTFKGPAHGEQGARVREEIEFVVEDFTRARQFLEALGYGVALIYEKYRAVYDLDGVQVTLDELPYGDFVELEGPGVPALQAASATLGLAWERAAPASYVMLFEALKRKMGLEMRDLTFAAFAGLDLDAADLDLLPADAGILSAR